MMLLNSANRKQMFSNCSFLSGKYFFSVLNMADLFSCVLLMLQHYGSFMVCVAAFLSLSCSIEQPAAPCAWY